MKKLLFSGLLLMALAVMTSGFTHKTVSFLTGTNLYVANTNNFNGSNMVYDRFPGTQTYLLPSGSGTNVVVVGRSAPIAFPFSPTNIYLYASTNGVLTTNVTIINTNAPVNPGAFVDVGIWPDANGDIAPLQLVVTLGVTNTTTTNQVFLTFGPGNEGAMTVTATNSWQVQFQPPATAQEWTFSTNVPSTFINANGQIRLLQIGVVGVVGANSANTNVLFRNIGIAGWAP